MSYHRILVIQLVVRAFSLIAGKESIHLVLVQVYQTGIAFVVLIVYIIDTTVTI